MATPENSCVYAATVISIQTKRKLRLGALFRKKVKPLKQLYCVV